MAYKLLWDKRSKRICSVTFAAKPSL